MRIQFFFFKNKNPPEQCLIGNLPESEEASEENNRSRLRHKRFAKYSRNHLQDRLLQIESKGIENMKKEQQEALKAKT